MSKVEVELNKQGIIELFKSPEVHDWLLKVGNEAAGKAKTIGEGDYSARVHNANYTAIVNVYPDNQDAAKDNGRNNTLVKAVAGLGLPGKKPRL